MAELEWLPDAIHDFDRLYSFLLDKDTDAARKAASTILKGTDLLKAAPRIGRLRPDDSENSRDLFMPFGAGAYVIRYKLVPGDTVIIIRVWHSRENR